MTPWLALASWGTALAGEEGGPPPHCQAGSHLSFVDPGVGLIFTAGCRWEFDSSLARPDGPSLGGQHQGSSSLLLSQLRDMVAGCGESHYCWAVGESCPSTSLLGDSP